MGRRKFSHRFGPFLARVLGPSFVRALGASWRVRFDPPDMPRRLRDDFPTVYAFWHGRLIMPTAVFTGYGMTVMISRHADGETVARISEGLGNLTVRGSSSRGGATALMEMVEALRGGCSGVFTPDGPRGPREEAQAGAVFAASRAGVPLVPLGAAAANAWELRSWDRFRIPKPFSRVVLVHGEPIHPPPDLEGEGLERYRALLEEGLRTVNGRAERLAAGKPS
jgi:lysophospholipid acyltransferase (LPLAT)-like uncharacterized protein